MKKELSRNDKIIRWADLLIFNSDHLGRVNKNSLMPLGLQNAEDINVWMNNEEGELRKDHTENEVIGYLEAVKNHLLSHRYIKAPIPLDRFWHLSEKGELMKELGGHLAYQNYRKSEIGLITNQGLINKLLILATGLAAVMPFIAAWLFTTKVYNTNNLPAPIFRPDIHIDTVWLREKVDAEIQKRLSTRKLQSTTSDTMPK